MSDSATMSVRALHRTDLPKLSLSTKAAATVLAIVAAVALPQLFHVIGAVSGQGTMLGVAFLPMHLPIIFVGLIAGPAVGAIAGAAAPLASFLLSGMPMLAMLPLMMVELCAYGLVAGLLREVKLPSLAKVVIAQLAGRVVLTAATAIAVFAFGSSKAVAATWTSDLAAGLPGAKPLRLAPVVISVGKSGETVMIAGVSITTLLLVLAAGIGAGFVGYAVGASSLISYPALLAFGIPPVLSNTTNTVGVCGTGIGGLLSARKELKGQGVRVAVYACIGLVGGIIGGLLLLELPAKVFECAVPPLILFSAIIIALNPRKKAAARDAVAQALPQSHQGERAARIASKTASGTLRNDPWWLWLGVSFVGVYSGYFGAAAGTLALAILDLGKIGPFHQINALKTVVGFGANISAAVMFIIRGSVDWPFAIMMCLGCTIGSAIAPPVTRHIPENIMRAAAVLTGIILAVKLGWSTYL